MSRLSPLTARFSTRQGRLLIKTRGYLELEDRGRLGCTPPQEKAASSQSLSPAAIDRGSCRRLSQEKSAYPCADLDRWAARPDRRTLDGVHMRPDREFPLFWKTMR